MRSTPTRDPLPLPEKRGGVTVPAIKEREDGQGWLAAEYQVLLAAIRFAGLHGFDEYAPGLSWALEDFFYTQGRWHDWCEIAQIAVNAAARRSDLLGQAVSHRSLGRAYGRLARYDEAGQHCQQAVELFERLGDAAGQAHAHTAAGFVTEQLGQLGETVFHTEQALALFRSAGHAAGEARADFETAIKYCQEAIELQRKAGNRTSEAAAWDSLAYVHRQRGALDQSIACYREALALSRQDGNRFDEAEALESIGNVHADAGDIDAAREALRGALAIFAEFHDGSASRLQARLETLARAGLRWGEPFAAQGG